MATNFLTKLFGSRNDRLLKQYRKTVVRINAMEPDYEKLSDEALRAKTQEFKERVAKGESLDDLLPEAFAVVREGSKRVMKMRHFDVQLLGDRKSTRLNSSHLVISYAVYCLKKEQELARGRDTRVGAPQ